MTEFTKTKAGTTKPAINIYEIALYKWLHERPTWLDKGPTRYVSNDYENLFVKFSVERAGISKQRARADHKAIEAAINNPKIVGYTEYETDGNTCCEKIHRLRLNDERCAGHFLVLHHFGLISAEACKLFVMLGLRTISDLSADSIYKPDVEKLFKEDAFIGEEYSYRRAWDRYRDHCHIEKIEASLDYETAVVRPQEELAKLYKEYSNMKDDTTPGPKLPTDCEILMAHPDVLLSPETRRAADAALSKLGINGLVLELYIRTYREEFLIPDAMIEEELAREAAQQQVQAEAEDACKAKRDAPMVGGRVVREPRLG